ncbi:hypothetical protein D3C81_1682250 [compost metagenome]
MDLHLYSRPECPPGCRKRMDCPQDARKRFAAGASQSPQRLWPARPEWSISTLRPGARLHSPASRVYGSALLLYRPACSGAHNHESGRSLFLKMQSGRISANIPDPVPAIPADPGGCNKHLHASRSNWPLMQPPVQSHTVRRQRPQLSPAPLSQGSQDPACPR